MRVVVSLEERFDRTPDGAVWTRGPFAHRFWTRYLEAFEEVGVVARVRDVREPTTDAKRADGPGVAFADLPCYIGPVEYLARLGDVRRAARAAVRVGEAVILRVASPIAACIEAALRHEGYPYALEVVGDPYDVFAPGAVRHPLRPFFRWWFPRQLRRQCARACAVGYVTERALQRRYAPGRETLSTHYSDVDLPESAFVSAPRTARPGAGRFTIVTVGSLAQLYKAPDVLLDAVAACAGGGLDVEVRLVGDGKHRAELESRAARLGLGERARFLGELPAGEAVRNQLDGADLFVLPSRTEGLPKAMVEAMARGMPCIGSSVGGIPELLAPEDLVPPGDPKALAAKIREVLADSDRRARMSARNLARARDYREALLGERRLAFYRYVRARTEAWLQAGGTR
jgi:glycosyltransferase involved in cell wall biosynthesis